MALTLGACAPALDWREMPLDATGLIVSFPCRPSRFERQVIVAGQSLTLFLLTCDVGEVTYGVATADVRDPAVVDAVLAGFAEGARAAIGAGAPVSQPLSLSGATPYRGNVALRLEGRRPDGSAIQESVLMFARGTRVFQASAIGSALAEPAIAPFRAGLHFRGVE